MKASKLIITGIVFIFIFLIVAALMTPPDLISQITLTVEMVVVCGILTFIISRFKSFKQTPESIKKLIIVMVFLLSISISCSVTFFMFYRQLKIAYNELKTEQIEKADLE